MRVCENTHTCMHTYIHTYIQNIQTGALGSCLCYLKIKLY